MESETKSEIIDATNRSLCQHGYAKLTMQQIADESSLTTAAIHYHFDTKEALLNAFLDDLIERFGSKLASEATDPRERLIAFLDAVFTPSDPEVDGFPVAIIRNQGEYLTLQGQDESDDTLHKPPVDFSLEFPKSAVSSAITP